MHLFRPLLPHSPSPSLANPAGSGHTRLSRREFLTGTLGTGAAVTGGALAQRALASTGGTQTRAPQFSTPIEHIVVMVRENRTYDNLFGLYPRGNGIQGGPVLDNCPDEVSPDLRHDGLAGNVALRVDGSTGLQGRCVYQQADVRGYWNLADQFVLCDNFYTEIMGPTMPNHLVLLAGRVTSPNNSAAGWLCPQVCYDFPTLADRADAAGLSWLHYGDSIYDIITNIEHLRDRPNLVNNRQFIADSLAGRLPNLSWLKADAQWSDHPPHSLHNGENWALVQVNALFASPQWESSAMIIVWDDWGGFYDHVRPPNVERVPDSDMQLRYGYRTGCLVISPYARPATISSTLYSHASVVALIDALFNLQPMTELDAQANNMLDCFDFSQSPIRPQPVQPVAPGGTE